MKHLYLLAPWCIALLAASTSLPTVADEEPEIRMKVTGRDIGYVTTLIEDSIKDGTLPRDLQTCREQLNAETKEEWTRLKKGYTSLGSQIRTVHSDPFQKMSDEEFKELVTQYRRAVGAFQMLTFRNQVKVFEQLPNEFKADLLAGTFDTRMTPKKRSGKTKNPSNLENGAARYAELDKEQRVKWDEIHGIYLAELNEFKASRQHKHIVKQGEVLLRALVTGNEKSAQAAYDTDVPLEVEIKMMQRRELQKLYGLLTEEQKEHSVKRREEQRRKTEARKAKNKPATSKAE